MNFEPFDTNVIVRRLQAQAQGLHLVGSAADYAAVKELRSFRTPSAYVAAFRAAFGLPAPNAAHRSQI